MNRVFLFAAFFICIIKLSAQDMPRPEYPRPQFIRSEWVNLNGKWDYVFDQNNTGKERGLIAAKSFNQQINVPFCPESKLSGVGYTDFINGMWYRKTIGLPAGWEQKKILLHFGGVDYQCEAYIDSNFVGVHYGGTSAFTFDITQAMQANCSHNLVLYVKDDTRGGTQPLGKQSIKFASSGAHYTRTTGIWQTVWMEAVDNNGLKNVKITPDLDRKQFLITPEFYNLAGQQVKITVKTGEKVVSSLIASNTGTAAVLLKYLKTWSPESPFLYDFIFEVLNKQGKVIDKVAAYAGMRKVHIEGNKVFLNNKPYYLRFVLDQGFYPDGIWTAPDDEALKRDIQLSQNAGFNGARLHQKVFEERFHYWADKLGYLTWAEASDWGPDRTKVETQRNLTEEWIETVGQRINHPDIIGWTPMNENWNNDDINYPRFNQFIYNLTHQLDASRPVITVAGGDIYQSDIWTVHDYAQDSTLLGQRLALKNGQPQFQIYHVSPKAVYQGQPFIVSEYGGIKWVTDPAYKNSWGYGKGPKNIEEAYTRMEQLTKAICNNPYISGYCFTQLTNVEQEQNGIYNYNRSPKFDVKRLKKIFGVTPSNYK
jgi:beta-galactosidase/beta-glucuronidase